MRVVAIEFPSEAFIRPAYGRLDLAHTSAVSPVSAKRYAKLTSY
jgi:hypothetical protein